MVKIISGELQTSNAAAKGWVRRSSPVSLLYIHGSIGYPSKVGGERRTGCLIAGGHQERSRRVDLVVGEDELRLRR
jgi:hypothetical protein